RAQQPGPDRALVVRPIALADATLIPRCVALRAGCQRPQTERGPELPLDGVDDLAGALALQEGVRQASDGEDLVGAQGGIEPAGYVIGIDYVVEAAGRGVPEAAREALHALGVERRVARREALRDAESIEPERLDLHRLPDPRGHDPVADLRVHPGELHPRLAGGEAAGVRGPASVAGAAATSRQGTLQ